METDNDRHNDQLDRTLTTALRGHKLPRRNDFADKMLVRLKEQQQQEILARVILQERLALAGIISLPIVAVVVILFFPETVIGFSAWLSDKCNIIAQSVLTLTDQWQLWMVALLAVGVAIYSVVDLILTED